MNLGFEIYFLLLFINYEIRFVWKKNGIFKKERVDYCNIKILKFGRWIGLGRMWMKWDWWVSLGYVKFEESFNFEMFRCWLEYV